MPSYFLQNDGDTILDDAGNLVGKKTALEAQGFLTRPYTDVSLTEADIPEPTQPGVMDPVKNAFASMAPAELSPYQAAPAATPQNFAAALRSNPATPAAMTVGQQFDRSVHDLSGGLGSQDVYTKAMNRVTGDLMAYDGVFERENTLRPKQVLNALTGMANRDTSGLFPFVSAVKRIPDDDLGGAAMRGLAGGAVDMMAGTGSLLEMAGTAGQMAFPWSSALPSSAPQIVTDAGRKVREYFQGPQQAIQQATPADLQGNILDKPELMADPRWLVENTAKAGVSMAPAILGGAGLGTMAGAAIGGAQEAAGSFQNMREKGQDGPEALGRSAVYGVASAALNKLGLDKILGPQAYSSMLRRGMGVLAAGGTEAFTEWLEEPTQAFLENIGRVPTPELIAEMKKSAVEGLNVVPPTFLLGAGGHALSGGAQAGKKADPYAALIQDAATQVGVDPAYLSSVMMAESGGKNIKASTSSASGLFQFTDSTWAGMVKQYGQQYGLTPDGRSDPRQQATAAALFTKDNADILRKSLGREPSSGELYMTAFLGSGGGPQFLAGMAQDPAAPAIRYASPAAVTANRSIFYDGGRARSAQEVYDLMAAKVGGSGAAQAAVAQSGQQAQAANAQPGLTAEEEAVAPPRPWGTTIPGEEEIDPALQQNVEETLGMVGGDPTLLQETGENEAMPAQAAQVTAPGVLAPDMTEGVAQPVPAPQMAAGEAVPTPGVVAPQVTQQVTPQVQPVPLGQEQMPAPAPVAQVAQPAPVPAAQVAQPAPIAQPDVQQTLATKSWGELVKMGKEAGIPAPGRMKKADLMTALTAKLAPAPQAAQAAAPGVSASQPAASIIPKQNAPQQAPGAAWAGHTTQDVQRAVPGGKVTETDYGQRVELPNGKTLHFKRTGEITLTAKRAKQAKEGGYASRGLEGGEIVGSMQMVNGEGVIRLTEAGRGQIDHEVMHFARKTALTNKENFLLDRAYPAKEEGDSANPEERIAQAYQAWIDKKGPDKTGLFAKILRFFEGIRQHLFPTATGVFRKVASGEVWNRGGTGVQQSGEQYATAYHGSPHRGIEKFNWEKHRMTGEGAAAYGEGTYLAGATETAKTYMPRDMKLEEKLQGMYSQAERRGDYTLMEVLESAMLHETPAELQARYGSEDYGKDYKAAANKVAAFIKKNSKQGQLYEADIPEADELMDWDKPLSQQPAGVREKLKEIARVHGVPLKNNVGEETTGAQLYSYLADRFAGNQRNDFGSGAGASEASRELRDVGIPGHRYLDGMSRGKGDGSHNYVIYDDSRVEITDTFYSIVAPVRGYAENNTGWSKKSGKVWEMLGILSDLDRRVSALVSEQRTPPQELAELFENNPDQKKLWTQGVAEANKRLKLDLPAFDEKGIVPQETLDILGKRKGELPDGIKNKVGQFIGGHGRSNAFEISKVLRDNQDLRAEVDAVQEQINSLFGLTPIVDKNGIVTLGIERRMPKYKSGKENPYRPQFGGFGRTFTQTFMDYLPDQVFETFRSEMTKAVEHAYRNGGNGIKGVKFMDKTLDTVSDSDFRTAGPVKKAEKTVGALNLNSACPMFMIGSHGCYLDGCYVTGMGMGGQGIVFYSRAAYTGEILQLSQEDVALLNSVGGLRVNGQGDLTSRQYGQLRDIVSHAKERSLKLKIITKQDATLEMLSKMHGEGVDISGVQVQTSIDPYWVPITEDELQDSFVQSAEMSRALKNDPGNANLERLVLDLYKSQGREARVINGVIYRKYGFSIERFNELNRQHPNVMILPRAVVGTPEEIVHYARNYPGILQTWMHAAIRPGLFSDVAGKVLGEGDVGNFTSRIAVYQDEAGEWHIQAQTNSANEKGGDAVFRLTKDIRGSRKSLVTVNAGLADLEQKAAEYRAALEVKDTPQTRDRLDKTESKISEAKAKRVSLESDMRDAYAERDRIINRRAVGIPLSESKNYKRVEDYIKTQSDADRIFRVLSGSLEEDASGLCCGAGADKDACNNCTSGCHQGADGWTGKTVKLADLRVKATDALTMQAKLAAKMAEIERSRMGQASSQEEAEDLGEAEDIQYSIKAKSEAPFYSQMQRVLEKPGMLPKIGRAGEMLAAIQKHVGKFKGVEFEESGLKDWLGAMGDNVVTRQAVLDEIASRQIEIKEVEKGNTPVLDPKELAPGYRIQKLGGNGMFLARTPGGMEQTFRSQDEAYAYLNKAFQNASSPDTKYGQYQVPGGENYKELLLTLPSEADGQSKRMSEIESALESTSIPFAERNALRQEYRDLSGKIRQANVYQSSHWDEPNVLAHVRTNERTDADGKRVLFIEEIQSDWHQEGKKKGYIGLSQSEQSRKADLESKPMAEWSEADTDWYNQRVNDAPRDGVPDAPFKNTSSWSMLAMKRMIRHAAENGFDRISWTPGDVQAERYDLSKQVGVVALSKSGTLVVEDLQGREVMRELNASQDRASDIVGKDVADKLYNQAPDKHGERELRGLDLKVGGEGMKGFYDAILPKEVAKYIKQFGGKVETWGGMWSFDLTDKMRDAAMEGQPLYSIKFSDPAAEATYQEGQKGIGDQRGLTARLKDKWATLYSGMTRHFTHLPMTKEFAKAHEILRQLEQAPNASQKTAIDWLQKMVGDLTRAEFDLFNRKVFLDDMGHDIQMGRVLPDGFTPAGHAMDMADVNAKVAATPKVQKALASRKTIHDALAKRLVAHGILDQDQLNNPSYFRHEVLKYAREWQNTQGSGKRLNKPMPGYAKKREGSSEMYSTHFLEVEFAYMHRALVDIATEGSIGKIKATYDKKAEAKAEAKKWNDAALVARGRRPAHIKEADKRQILGKTYRTWRDYIPDGYTTFQPSKGLLYLTGNSITDAAVQELLDAQQGRNPADRAILEALDGVREAMQVVGKKPELVIPEPLAEQLEALKPQRTPSFFDEALSEAVGKWKQWQLFNPHRWIKYNVNNMSGDLDGVFAAIRVGEYGKFFRHFVPAVKELYAVAKGKAAPSDLYTKARWAGVIDSGLTVGEIPDISGLGEFERLVAKETGRGALLKPLRAYWRAAQGSSEFRESLMRYTAFRYYMTELGKGRTVAQLGYGASYQPLVDGLDTDEAKAALLSRDLLVDYGAISAYGMQLRNRIFPFYSWMEGNLKRYNRIFSNAVKEGPVEGFKAGGIIGASLGARFTAYTAIRASMVYAAIALWNNLMWPDEERELETADRLQLHVIVGRDDKGDVQTIRLQGALSDYLGWAGFPDVVSVLMKAQDGKASYGDILKTMAKAPLNRLINSLTPIIKTPIEMASGYSLYPDSFTPRKISDREREAAKTFSLDNELDAFRHWKDGTPVKDSYWGSWKKALIYERNVGETNYAAMRDRIKDFKESKGIETSGWSTSPKAELSKQYRLATKWGDKEAADKLRERMINELGISASEVDKTIKESLLRAAPLAGVPKKEKDEFLASLSPRDHERLVQATKWYQETYLEGAGLEKDFYLKEVGGDARRDKAQMKEMYKDGDKEGAKAFAKDNDLGVRSGLTAAAEKQLRILAHRRKLLEESKLSPARKEQELQRLEQLEEKVKDAFVKRLQGKGVQPRM